MTMKAWVNQSQSSAQQKPDQKNLGRQMKDRCNESWHSWRNWQSQASNEVKENKVKNQWSVCVDTWEQDWHRHQHIVWVLLRENPQKMCHTNDSWLSRKSRALHNAEAETDCLLHSRVTSPCKAPQQNQVERSTQKSWVNSISKKSNGSKGTAIRDTSEQLHNPKSSELYKNTKKQDGGFFNLLGDTFFI